MIDLGVLVVLVGDPLLGEFCLEVYFDFLEVFCAV